MTRLYDRLMAGDRVESRTRGFLRQATVVVADNVAEYFYAGSDQEVWDSTRDFPNVAPPLGTMFVEFTAPAMINSREEGQTPWGDLRPTAWGVLLCAREMADALSDRGVEEADGRLSEEERSLLPVLQRAEDLGAGDLAAGIARLPWVEQEQLRRAVGVRRARAEYGSPEKRDELLAAVAAGTAPRWGMEAMLFAQYRTRRAEGLWHWQYCVRADGTIFPVAKDGWCSQGPVAAHEAALVREHGQAVFQDLSSMFSPLLQCAFLALSFMHCKNVIVHDVDPLKEWRERNPKKKGYSPVLVRYKVLDIEPMKQVLRQEGGSEKTGIKRALHITRGHFADYTGGKGLFGRIHGRFWVPMHVRGTPDAGAVVKDYRVLSPAQGGKGR